MYLTADELKSIYYKKAAAMPADDISTYLQRANSLAYGVVGGIPQNLTAEETAALKSAVAMAFEIFVIGESAQVDPVNGTVTEYAPEGAFTRKTYKDSDPFKAVRDMLQPFTDKVKAQNTVQSNRGVMFL